MNQKPLISICIPTYNREKFLKISLDNIINQEGYNEDEIEIVISDNASIDNTSNLVKNYQKKHQNIRYFRNETNIGWDRNILKILQMWNWEYIWWISDDDILLPWWLKIVKETILENLDKDIWLFQTNYSVFNEDMKTFLRESYVGKDVKTKIYKNVDELYRSYSYCHWWLAFFSINIFSSKMYTLDLNRIPITQFPHSCVVWLISDKKAMFIGYNTIWFRQNNSSHENIWSSRVFFKLFVIDHMKYMSFLKSNNSIVSQKQLTYILIKMFIYSCFLGSKSLTKKLYKVIKFK